jgi:hypothetical protein
MIKNLIIITIAVLLVNNSTAIMVALWSLQRGRTPEDHEHARKLIKLLRTPTIGTLIKFLRRHDDDDI